MSTSRIFGATLGRGLLAGAAGTVALDAVTYLDMLLRRRPASEVPARTARAALDRAGVPLDGPQAEAVGALSGLAAGAGVGVVAAAVRASGIRLSPVGGTVLAGGLAMAASDGSAAVAGVTDPTTWEATDWAADVVPHLAYGFVVQGVVRRLDPGAARGARPRPGLLARSFLLGLASGSRSSLGLAGAALTSSRTTPRLVAGALVVGELVGDKLPQAPSRLGPEGFVPRQGTAAIGAAALAAREGARADLPVVLGGMGAALGAAAGLAWREGTTWEPLPAALAEDAAAVLLTLLAVRRPRR